MKPILPLLLALALAAAPVRASDHDDHERARQALEAGEIMPLHAIIAAIAARVPGRMIEAELERDDGRWIYELEIISSDGILAEVEVDAATGKILEIERENRKRRGDD